MLKNLKDLKEVAEISQEDKLLVLEALGYGVDSERRVVTLENKKLHKCPISKRPVKVDNASIVPGSTLVINSDALSFAEYFSQYFETS